MKPFVPPSGFARTPYATGQKIADVKAAVDYETGAVRYFRVLIGASKHNFLTFEEAMLFCDINGYYVDTKNWGNPKLGMNKFYSSSTKVKLEDGRVLEIGD